MRSVNPLRTFATSKAKLPTLKFKCAHLEHKNWQKHTPLNRSDTTHCLLLLKNPLHVIGESIGRIFK